MTDKTRVLGTWCVSVDIDAKKEETSYIKIDGDVLKEAGVIHKNRNGKTTITVKRPMETCGQKVKVVLPSHL